MTNEELLAQLATAAGMALDGGTTNPFLAPPGSTPVLAVPTLTQAQKDGLTTLGGWLLWLAINTSTTPIPVVIPPTAGD